MSYENRSYLGTEDTPLVAPTGDDRTFAVLSHILTVVPGVGILGPLIIYLIKNKDSQFVSVHAKESLNFQITILILYFISILLVILLIGFLLLWVIGIVNIILAIVASIRASEGKLYRYPFNIRIVK
ncbi:DUF4870 domain-containing protein [Flavitalea antarctica]